MATATWQLRLGSQWLDIDAATCAQIDQTMFSMTMPSSVPLSGTVGGGGGIAITNMPFDFQDLTWDGAQVRRSKKMDPATRNMTFEYWDDMAWIAYDDFAQTTLVDAVQARMQSVAIRVNDFVFEVALNMPNDLIQSSRASHRFRPVRMIQSMMSVATVPLAMSPDDDGTVPDELKCPITQMPMQDPVTASDGVSYERKAIERWMTNKTVSPSTNLPISQTLYPSINIRKLLEAKCAEQASMIAAAASMAETTAPPPSLRKRKRVRHTFKCAECQTTLDYDANITLCHGCSDAVGCEGCIDADGKFQCSECKA